MRAVLVLAALSAVGGGEELVAVLAVWRHGDRAPSGKAFPNDVHDERAWPRGWNQLTNEGIRQAYQLGHYLRTRYVDEREFLSPSYSHKEIFMRSSDENRALETAQAVAAGLFPPSGNRIWSYDLNWQPIPVHSNGYGEPDPVLKPTSTECTAYEELKDEDAEELYEELNEYLSDMAGTTIDASNVATLYNIHREILHSLSQPDWVTSPYRGTDILKAIAEFKRAIRVKEFDTEEKAKLMGGSLLNNLLTYVENVRYNITVPKAVLYSSHDGTLLALLAALGHTQELLIPYTGMVLFEISRTDDGHAFVEVISAAGPCKAQVLYRNSTTAAPMPLRIGNCYERCPINDFLELLEDMRIWDEDEFWEVCLRQMILEIQLCAASQLDKLFVLLLTIFIVHQLLNF